MKRNESGRDLIMKAATAEIHRKGFQSAGLNEILERAGLTKGSLYHHFKTKKQLGYAVLEEVVRGWIEALWIEPLQSNKDAVDLILEILRSTEKISESSLLNAGCMLLNLSQEMSPLDEGFRLRAQSVFDDWRKAIETVLKRDQRAGRIRKDLNVKAVAAFVVACQEGALSLAKNAQRTEMLTLCHDQLAGYLEGLRSR